MESERGDIAVSTVGTRFGRALVKRNGLYGGIGGAANAVSGAI